MENATTVTGTGVVIVDDDADFRLCLKDILHGAAGYRLIGGFSNSAAALDAIPKLNPDLVLMDVRLPGLDGIECTKNLRQIMPGLRVVMLSGMHDDQSIEQSVSAGAVAYLVKPLTPHQCLATLKCVMALGTTAQRPESESSPAHPLLTQRENEIMKHLAGGLLYKEIADRLDISYSAVHKLQHKIYAKLHATNRTEAISRWRGEKEFSMRSSGCGIDQAGPRGMEGTVSSPRLFRPLFKKSKSG